MKAILSALVAFSLLTSCGDPSANDRAENGPIQEVKPPRSVVSDPIDYGQNLMYFPCNSKFFGLSLTKYLREHDSLEVTAICGDGTGGYGSDRGYWVAFKKKI